jgi:pimeloyl-ACP methyl ester carboxylesterase
MKEAIAEVHSLVLRDGRRLAWADYGDPAGRPVLYLHGIPGSRLEIAGADAAARTAGLRLIAVDRPGCGRSDPRPDLTFGNYAADVSQLLDELSVSAVDVAAASGGGGFGLGLAARSQGRVRRLILICAMAPSVPREALRGRQPRISFAYALARRAPWLLRPWLRRQVRSLAAADPARLARWARGLPPADRAAMLDPKLRQIINLDAAEALRQGAAAAVGELALYGQPPGFALTDIVVAVHLLHGAEDHTVPVGVAEWLARQLPNATLEVVPGAGHWFAIATPDRVMQLLS